jgi:hypothetical protein
MIDIPGSKYRTSPSARRQDVSFARRGTQPRGLSKTKPQYARSREVELPAEPQQKETAQPAQHQRSIWPTLFILSLVLPWMIYIGPVRMSVYRFVLIAAFVPSIIMWASGKVGRIRIADIAFLLYPIWCTLGLAYNHGWDVALQPGGILLIETFGTYLLARCYIRTADDFYHMVLTLFRVVAFTLPFAIIETITSRDVMLDIFRMVLPSHVIAYTEPRWGLRRVQAFFEHPILFGVFTGSVFALVHLVLGYGKTFFQRFKKSGLVALTAFLSLSSGPLSALAAQTALIAWNYFLRHNAYRWKILAVLLLAMYVVIAIGSNQSVPEFYMTHFSFDQASAYYRVLIWTFGSSSALNHPFFGVGLNEWERPDWMPPSIDMFWLYHAVRYGIPAAFFILIGFISMCCAVGFKRGLGAKLTEYRIAYLIAMTSLFLVGWTVHFWNVTYVSFVFLVGSGAWLLDVKDEGDEVSGQRSGVNP